MIIETCSGVIQDRDLCKHGFTTNGGCYGFGIPMCMNEHLCGRLFRETGGKPIACPLPRSAARHSRTAHS